MMTFKDQSFLDKILDCSPIAPWSSCQILDKKHENSEFVLILKKKIVNDELRQYSFFGQKFDTKSVS